MFFSLVREHAGSRKWAGPGEGRHAAACLHGLAQRRLKVGHARRHLVVDALLPAALHVGGEALALGPYGPVAVAVNLLEVYQLQLLQILLQTQRAVSQSHHRAHQVYCMLCICNVQLQWCRGRSSAIGACLICTRS